MTIRTQLDPISFISKSSSNKAVPLAHELSEYELQMGARLGIDNHADTSCAGKKVKILEYVQGVSFSVAPFQGPHIKNISLANGVVAVDREDGTNSSQAVILDDDNAIPTYYHGPIPFIHIRYPTDDDLDTYKWYQLTNNST